MELNLKLLHNKHTSVESSSFLYKLNLSLRKEYKVFWNLT